MANPGLQVNGQQIVFQTHRLVAKEPLVLRSAPLKR
jgi:hypothetical protein